MSVYIERKRRIGACGSSIRKVAGTSIEAATSSVYCSWLPVETVWYTVFDGHPALRWWMSKNGVKSQTEFVAAEFGATSQLYAKSP